MLVTVLLPIGGIFIQPVLPIGEIGFPVALLVVFVGEALLLALAVLTSTSNLAVAEARMWTEQLTAIGASFLSSHLLKMSEKATWGVAKFRGSARGGSYPPPAHRLLTGRRGAWITPRL